MATELSDVEKQSLNAHVAAVQGEEGMNDLGLRGESLHKGLKSRHIQMISIGGLEPEHSQRPVSQLPLPGGHITLAQRFVDPAFSFMMGWNYWYNWTIVLPAELNAAAVLIGYWNSSINPAVWITICGLVAVTINFGGSRVYGEMEFWFAIIKVIAIVGLIILGIILSAGGGPDHVAIGFRYWRNPGPFVQYLGMAGAKGRFLGYWAVLIQAAFSFLGTEIVALAAGETKNPKKTIPRAIKRVYIRILLFYILGTFIIGILVSSSDPRLALGTGTAASSPFVIAISNSGIKALPGIVNACLLTSAWSAASSDLYTSSRGLYALAVNGNAPKIFTRVNRWGLPYVAVITGSLFALLSYMSAGAAKASEVFNWFANMTSVCGLITWVGICFTYLRFYKGTKIQGIDRKSFVYTAPLQPYLTYYAMIFCMIILFFNGWTVFYDYNAKDFDHATFWTSYIPIIILPFTYFGYKFTRNVKFQTYQSMDYITGSRGGLVEEEGDDGPKKNFFQKVAAAVV
ncbi:amino acid transmembrane transporter [Pseudohyphozyma bogoriensis]|nr:amino acid transmembrane transporter [Pseudohyphozyma bogoriensis]